MSLRSICPFCLFQCFPLAKRTIKFARYLVQFLACSCTLYLLRHSSYVSISLLKMEKMSQVFPDYYTTRWHLTNSNTSSSYKSETKSAQVRTFTRLTALTAFRCPFPFSSEKVVGIQRTIATVENRAFGHTRFNTFSG